MKNKLKVIDIAYISLASVLITICSWISIPSTVPFTMQTFAIFFILLLLGGKRGTLSIIVYIMLGIIGLPVFSNFSSGISAILSTTGGYIIGFIFIGITYWIFTSIFKQKLLFEIISLIIGLIICYSFGTFWFMIVFTQTSGTVGLLMVLSWCVFPFIIPDLIKLFIAFTFAKKIKSIINIK